MTTIKKTHPPCERDLALTGAPHDGHAAASLLIEWPHDLHLISFVAMRLFL